MDLVQGYRLGDIATVYADGLAYLELNDPTDIGAFKSVADGIRNLGISMFDDAVEPVGTDEILANLPDDEEQM